MAKDLKEQIEIMTHYLNGGEIECVEKGNDNWEIVTKPLWNFDDFEYRIKEPKQKVTIEKWLIKDVNSGEYFIKEGEPKHLLYANKLKLQILIIITYMKKLSLWKFTR